MKNQIPDTAHRIHFAEIFNLEDIQRLQDLFSAATGVASLITHPDGTPITKDIYACKSWEASESIDVGGIHIANWLIGQVPDSEPRLTAEQFKKVSDMLFAFANELSEKAYANWQLKVQIAEQKKAAALLLGSEEKFRAIFENVQDVFYQTNLAGTVLEISPSIKHFSEFNRDEIIGKPVADLYANPVDRVILLHEIKKNGELRDYELNLKTKSGAIRHVSINARLIRDADGRPDHIDGAIRDMTERKRAEEEIREIGDQHRVILKTAMDGFWLVNLQGRLLEVNESYCRMSGYSEKELLSMSISDLEVMEASNETAAHIQNIISQGEDRFDTRHRRKDGSVFDVDISAQYRPSDGGLIVAFLHDISNRKRSVEILQASEEKYRTMIDYSNDLIWTLDSNGNFTFLNGIASTTTGLDLNEWKGKSFTPLILKEDLPMIMEVFNRTMKGEACMYELRFKKPDERILTISVNTSPIYISGKVEGVVSFGRDITEQKKTDIALQEAREKAESGDRLKTAFMNNISHEIRTPLNSILGFSQLITQPDLATEDRKTFFTLIKASSDRLISTVTNYMDISLITSGNLEVKREPFSLHQALDQLLGQFQPLCADKSIGLHLEIPEKTSLFTINSDAELFQKALSHLLDNAVKFTTKGEIAFGYALQSGLLEFYVKDTGIGIGAESLSLIFDSFDQEESSITSGFEGSGLGLSIARGIVHLLGGELRIESAKDKGSTFFFTLPYDEMAVGTKTEEAVPAIPFPAKPVILIAEDDGTNLTYLGAILHGLGLSVQSARNGKQAVEECLAHPEISLVLMDLKMPVMDGFEATRAIRSFRKDLPVIAVTAFAMISDKRKAREAGCNDYLAKPVSKEMLIKILRKFGLKI